MTTLTTHQMLVTLPLSDLCKSLVENTSGDITEIDDEAVGAVYNAIYARAHRKTEGSVWEPGQPTTKDAHQMASLYLWNYTHNNGPAW
jgi:hypothetical protein